MLDCQTKIAIANRGEVACRIHRAIKKLGATSILLHSDPDKNSTAYRICDETSNIGEGPSSKSYLNIENVIQGALKAGATALHPGFGFLSENAEFARACEKNGLIFIGPRPESMDLFGNKISAKDFCEKEDIPTLKSYRGKDQSLERLKKEAKEITYPVLVKAAAGGGGRGMRVVSSESELESSLKSAKNEALKAFGSDEMFLEKYLAAAKHIEVQIFGTGTGDAFILGERECSVQRRHQKIIEEALSPSLSNKQRRDLYSYAKVLTEKSSYLGAGTVEFLFDGDQFYFLEVNTRLQVEHPVTEQVLNIDLVEAQIKTAFKLDLGWDQKKLNPSKHSIECRIYAEDLKGFPSIGELGSMFLGYDQDRKNIRLESGFEKGDTITSFYDSMIAKIICTEDNRETCILKLIQHLRNSVITGIHTNIPLLIKILEHPDFVNGTMNTDFFKINFEDGVLSPWSEDQVNDVKEHCFSSSKYRTLKSVFNKKWRSSL